MTVVAPPRSPAARRTPPISFTPEKSTCPDDPGEPSTVTYALGATTLTVQFPDGVIALERNTSEGASNAILQYGCGRTGRFVRAPLAPVKR